MYTGFCPDLVEICHLIASDHYTSATGGNLSCRMPDGNIWITPSALHKRRVQLEDLVKVGSDGQVLEGDRDPSSEMIVHLSVYRSLPKAGAVIHAHPPAATGFAQSGRQINTNSSCEAYFHLGPEVPIIPYGRSSTPELAETVGQAVNPRHKAYLLANHGVLTWGEDLFEAYDVRDTLEMFAQSLVAAHVIDGTVALSEEELRWLDDLRVARTGEQQ